MKLITISGLDGSGKSTQIKLLRNYLESENKKVFYFHTIEFGIANKILEFKKKYCIICKILRKCKIKDNLTSVQDSNKKSVIKANRAQIQLRKIALKIDICRFKSLQKKLEKENYDYVVSDRYFYDSVVNIQYLSLDRHPEFISGSKSTKILKQACLPVGKIQNDNEKLNWNIEKPDTAIYLDADPEKIMSRNRKPDQGINYLKDKKEIFDSIFQKWNMKKIDGNRDKFSVFEEIKKTI